MQIQTEHFTQALYNLLDEVFDHVHGYFLDKGTSLFETLATVSAEEASVPVGGSGISTSRVGYHCRPAPLERCLGGLGL